jgi:FKBP-type peptidyl-prolyl cis-trans isomerase 2
MQQPDGRAANVLVVEVGEDSVKIDANHPLAGQVLIFDLEVTEITPGA